MSDQKKLIAVVGATGSQGGSVLKYLIDSGRYRVRALTRDVLSSKALSLKTKYLNNIELWKCDMCNSDEVIKAFDGCWGAYLLTDFWSDPEKMVVEEANYGRILIDSAVTANLTFAIYSSLNNVEILSEGRLQVPHFTNKNLVEEYARNEFRGKDVKTKFGFVYPGFYMQNFMFLPGITLKLNQNGVLENDPLPINADTQIPMINIEELGKWVLPMFDNWQQFVNNIVFASNGYITIPRFMEIVAKKLGTTFNFRTCTYDEFYKTSENLEMVHMFRYFNDIGYYGGAQLGKWTQGIMSVEDAITSLDWGSLKPGLTQKISDTVSNVKNTVMGAFGAKATDTSQSAE